VAPNERVRGGCPDRSNAWGRVSWTRAEVLVDDLAISGTSTGIRASSRLFDFSVLSLFVYARVQCACYLIRLLFNEYTCIAKVLRNLHRKYCRVRCGFFSLSVFLWVYFAYIDALQNVVYDVCSFRIIHCSYVEYVNPLSLTKSYLAYMM
jgi:hypothetical protein